jgi:hypothetical protein
MLFQIPSWFFFFEPSDGRIILKMVFKGLGWECVDFIHLLEDEL